MVPAFVKLQQDKQGNQILLPMGGGSHGWEYRVDAFQQAGIDAFPKTWDEWIDACQKLVTKDGRRQDHPRGHRLGGSGHTVPASSSRS